MWLCGHLPGYPIGAGGALLDGRPPLRLTCAVCGRFAYPWRMDLVGLLRVGDPCLVTDVKFGASFFWEGKGGRRTLLICIPLRSECRSGSRASVLARVRVQAESGQAERWPVFMGTGTLARR